MARSTGMTRAQAREHIASGGTLRLDVACETHSYIAEVRLLTGNPRFGCITFRSTVHYPRQIGVLLSQIENFIRLHYR